MNDKKNKTWSFNERLRHLLHSIIEYESSNYYLLLANHFSKNHDLTAIINWIWKFSYFHCLFFEKPKFKHKDDKEAKRYRTRANEAYMRKSMEESLLLHNCSIIFENYQEFHKVSSIAQSYSSRSQILFDVGEYEKCLLDIERARKHGIPRSKMAELDAREERCRKSLKTISSAKKEEKTSSRLECCKLHSEVRKHLDDPDLDLTKKFRYLFYNERIAIPDLGATQRNVPGLSDSVDIGCDDGGRYIYATRDIYPGEIILKENVFSHELLPNVHLRQCTFCLKRVSTPVPCHKCTTVVFCDEECRTEASEDFHFYECGILHSLLEMQVEGVVTAVRALLKIPFKKFFKLPKLYEKEARNRKPEKLGFNDQGIFESEDFRTIYGLPTYLDKRTFDEIMMKTIIGMVVMKYLAWDGNYIGRNVKLSPDEDLPHEMVLLAWMITKMLLITSMHRHQHSEITINKSQKEDYKEPIGYKLSPLIGLIKHSCYPSVETYNYGTVTVARATHLISSGEILSICHGLLFNICRNYDERMLYHKIFNFSCTCDACSEEWPMTKDLYKKISVLCPYCDNELDFEKGCQLCQRNSFQFPKFIAERNLQLAPLNSGSYLGNKKGLKKRMSRGKIVLMLSNPDGMNQNAIVKGPLKEDLSVKTVVEDQQRTLLDGEGLLSQDVGAHKNLAASKDLSFVQVNSNNGDQVFNEEVSNLSNQTFNEKIEDSSGFSNFNDLKTKPKKPLLETPKDPVYVPIHLVRKDKDGLLISETLYEKDRVMGQLLEDCNFHTLESPNCFRCLRLIHFATFLDDIIYGEDTLSAVDELDLKDEHYTAPNNCTCVAELLDSDVCCRCFCPEFRAQFAMKGNELLIKNKDSSRVCSRRLFQYYCKCYSSEIINSEQLVSIIERNGAISQEVKTSETNEPATQHIEAVNSSKEIQKNSESACSIDKNNNAVKQRILNGKDKSEIPDAAVPPPSEVTTESPSFIENPIEFITQETPCKKTKSPSEYASLVHSTEISTIQAHSICSLDDTKDGISEGNFRMETTEASPLIGIASNESNVESFPPEDVLNSSQNSAETSIGTCEQICLQDNVGNSSNCEKEFDDKYCQKLRVPLVENSQATQVQHCHKGLQPDNTARDESTRNNCMVFPNVLSVAELAEPTYQQLQSGNSSLASHGTPSSRIEDEFIPPHVQQESCEESSTKNQAESPEQSCIQGPPELCLKQSSSQEQRELNRFSLQSAKCLEQSLLQPSVGSEEFSCLQALAKSLELSLQALIRHHEIFFHTHIKILLEPTSQVDPSELSSVDENPISLGCSPNSPSEPQSILHDQSSFEAQASFSDTSLQGDTRGCSLKSKERLPELSSPLNQTSSHNETSSTQVFIMDEHEATQVFIMDEDSSPPPSRQVEANSFDSNSSQFQDIANPSQQASIESHKPTSVKVKVNLHEQSSIQTQLENQNANQACETSLQGLTGKGCDPQEELHVPLEFLPRHLHRDSLGIEGSFPSILASLDMILQDSKDLELKFPNLKSPGESCDLKYSVDWADSLDVDYYKNDTKETNNSKTASRKRRKKQSGTITLSSKEIHTHVKDIMLDYNKAVIKWNSFRYFDDKDVETVRLAITVMNKFVAIPCLMFVNAIHLLKEYYNMSSCHYHSWLDYAIIESDKNEIKRKQAYKLEENDKNKVKRKGRNRH